MRRSFKLGASVPMSIPRYIERDNDIFLDARKYFSRTNTLLLPSRTSREQTDPMLRLLRTLPATIPVLNYHKPLTPARTKLFLHSDSTQLIITILFDIEYSVYFYIFHTSTLHILKT